MSCDNKMTAEVKAETQSHANKFFSKFLADIPEKKIGYNPQVCPHCGKSYKADDAFAAFCDSCASGYIP